MPQITVAIVKETSFRQANQEFSNVYTYRYAVGAEVEHQALIDEIVGIERNLHSTTVNFKRAAIWTSGGDKQQNRMLYQTQLSGTGNQTVATAMDMERAVLFQWPAGLSTTGKPVFLRKWFHSCGACAGATFTNAQLQNRDPLTDTQRNAIATEANKLRLVGQLDTHLLVAESGREHTGPGSAHKWLEHRQLGDQWR